jgi:hypothetical protein
MELDVSKCDKHDDIGDFDNDLILKAVLLSPGVEASNSLILLEGEDKSSRLKHRPLPSLPVTEDNSESPP